MRYIAKLYFITVLSIVSASAQTIATTIHEHQSPKAVLTAVSLSVDEFFAAGGVEFSAAMPQVTKKAEDVVIPSPSFHYDNPGKASSKITEHYLYMPMQYRMVYVYEHTSSEFTGSRKVVVEYKNYSSKDSMTYGTITLYEGNSAKSRNFYIKATSNGIFVSDSLISVARTEIPTPLFQGQIWKDGHLTNSVTSFEARVSVPAGNFTNCLGITARIGGADPGTDDRIYAPEVGLVVENIITDNKQESFKLLSYYRK